MGLIEVLKILKHFFFIIIGTAWLVVFLQISSSMPPWKRIHLIQTRHY